MEHQTPLKKFNVTLNNFIEDLKNIFGADDKDIIKMESAMDLTSVNARIILTPFQTYALQPTFIRGIVQEDIDFFLHNNFDFIKETEYTTYLLNKLRAVITQMRDDRETTSKIFNWFKMLLYYALEDVGRIPIDEFKKCCM
jgi:hypothetical protein